MDAKIAQLVSPYLRFSGHLIIASLIVELGIASRRGEAHITCTGHHTKFQRTIVPSTGRLLWDQAPCNHHILQENGASRSKISKSC